MKIGLDIKKISTISDGVSVINDLIKKGDHVAYKGHSTMVYQNIYGHKSIIAIAAAMILSIGCDAPQTKKEPPPIEPIGRATVGYIREKTNNTPSKIRTLSNGMQLEIQTFLWVISDLEVHMCPKKKTARFSLIPSAHAHVPDSATRLGAPFVEDFLGPEGKANIVGELAPPFGTFCTMYVIIAPADDDIINTTSTSTDTLEGFSVLIKGRRRSSPDAAWTTFEHKGDGHYVFKLPLQDSKTPGQPLTIAEKQSGFILLDKKLDDAFYNKHFQSPALDMKTIGPQIVRDLGQRLKQYKPRTTP